MAIVKIKPIKCTVKKAIDYITDDEKTDQGLLISTHACAHQTADIEFEQTRDKAGGRGTNLAYHLIQSFKPGEISVEEAHRIGQELAQDVLHGQYEFVLSTHIDKGHIHNHIIFNATSYISRKKYHDSKKSYKYIRKVSDRICKENGLDVIEKESGNRGKSYYEDMQNKKGNSWKAKLKQAIDETVKSAQDWEEFLLQMQMKGYEIKEGEYIAFRAVNQQRFTRAKSIGNYYTESKLKDRIKNKNIYEESIENEYGTEKKAKKKYYQDDKINLIVDLQNNSKALENGGYKHRMEINNVNQMARTLSYLIDNKYESTEALHDEIKKEQMKYQDAKKQIMNLDNNMSVLSEKIKYAQNYWKYKKVSEQLRTKNIPASFIEEHRKELVLFEAARNYLNKNSINIRELNVKEMISEYQKLKSTRNEFDLQYKTAAARLKELETVKHNIDKILHKEKARENKDMDVEK